MLQGKKRKQHNLRKSLQKTKQRKKDTALPKIYKKKRKYKKNNDELKSVPPTETSLQNNINIIAKVNFV